MIGQSLASLRRYEIACSATCESWRTIIPYFCPENRLRLCLRTFCGFLADSRIPAGPDRGGKADAGPRRVCGRAGFPRQCTLPGRHAAISGSFPSFARCGGARVPGIRRAAPAWVAAMRAARIPPRPHSAGFSRPLPFHPEAPVCVAPPTANPYPEAEGRALQTAALSAPWRVAFPAPRTAPKAAIPIRCAFFRM